MASPAVWFTTTLLAFWLASSEAFAIHRQFMIRSYLLRGRVTTGAGRDLAFRFRPEADIRVFSSRQAPVSAECADRNGSHSSWKDLSGR